MREILFRGKSIDSRKWTYGSLIRTRCDSYILEERVCLPVKSINVEAFENVYDFTVGQYTGMIAGQTKIFEGDIVVHGGEIFEVVFNLGRFVMMDKSGGRTSHMPFDPDLKIVGNIHDK